MWFCWGWGTWLDKCAIVIQCLQVWKVLSWEVKRHDSYRWVTGLCRYPGCWVSEDPWGCLCWDQSGHVYPLWGNSSHVPILRRLVGKHSKWAKYGSSRLTTLTDSAKLVSTKWSTAKWTNALRILAKHLFLSTIPEAE